LREGKYISKKYISKKYIFTKYRLLFTGISFILCMIFYTAGSAFADEAEEDPLSHPDYVLEEGITIDGVDVSGLTEQETLEKVGNSQKPKEPERLL
jgi:hypothetical protein